MRPLTRPALVALAAAAWERGRLARPCASRTHLALVALAAVLLAVACQPPAAAPPRASSAPVPSGAGPAPAPAQPAAATPEPPAETITLAYPSASISWLAVLVADRQGFFAEERLTPQFIQMAPAANVLAVLAGDVDYALGLTSVAQAAVQQDAPIRGIMALAVRPQHRLMVRPEVRTFADLRGKVIAINTRNDITDWEARVILQRNGIPLDDVSLQPIPSSPARLAGLDTGQFAATIMASPFDLQAEAQGYGELGRISRDIEIAWMGLAAAQRTIAERRDTVRRTLRASLRGIEYTRTHRDDVLRIVQDALDMEPPIAAASYALGLDTWSEDGTASEEAWRNTLEIARMAGPVPPNVPFEQYVDKTILEEARQSLRPPR
jgi:ABC-type nitrate/sulfonate/bicarbonate transport system substrate-binding protein